MRATISPLTESLDDGGGDGLLGISIFDPLISYGCVLLYQDIINYNSYFASYYFKLPYKQKHLDLLIDITKGKKIEQVVVLAEFDNTRGCAKIFILTQPLVYVVCLVLCFAVYDVFLCFGGV